MAKEIHHNKALETAAQRVLERVKKMDKNNNTEEIMLENQKLKVKKTDAMGRTKIG